MQSRLTIRSSSSDFTCLPLTIMPVSRISIGPEDGFLLAFLRMSKVSGILATNTSLFAGLLPRFRPWEADF
jgi:hypothetical protein